MYCHTFVSREERCKIDLGVHLMTNKDMDYPLQQLEISLPNTFPFCVSCTIISIFYVNVLNIYKTKYMIYYNEYDKMGSHKK